MPILDIALAMDVFAKAQGRPNPRPKHLREDVPIAEDLIIGPVAAYKRAVIDACDPKGINWNRPYRQFGSQYGMVRLNPPGRTNEFDADSRLRTCVQLSRLVHPTALSFDFAGRLVTTGDGSISEFAPARFRGGARDAYVADPAHNWLDDGHVAELRVLMAAFNPDTIPERVLRALFYHEYAHQLYYVDARWPMMTTGIEALLHTDRHSSTRQFVERALQVQRELGLQVASENDLLAIYGFRSSLTHGQSLGGLGEEQARLYRALEALLRGAVRRAIENPEFGAVFQTDDAIRARWPLA